MVATHDLPRRFDWPVAGPYCHEGGVRGHGDPSDGVVIIGIAPGRDEVDAGIPFVGQSGRLLDSILEAVGWSRSRVWCTNLICWWNDAPNDQEIAACNHRLTNELAWVRPRLVIGLGTIVNEVFLHKPLGGSRGRPVWQSAIGAYYMGTYHPAAVLHGGPQAGDILRNIVRDFEKIPSILSWPLGGRIADVDYRVVQSMEDAQAVLDRLPRGHTYVAIDIETTNPETDTIDPFKDELLCLSISTPDMTYTFPKHVLIPGALTWPIDVRWTGQFGTFDVMGLRRLLGVDIPLVEDTGLMSYARDERQGHHKLEIQADEYCGANGYKKLVNRKHLELEPVEKVYEYNARDSEYTRRLALLHEPSLIADDVYDLYRDILMPAARAYAEITYQGMTIDRQALEDLCERFFPVWQSKELELQDIAEDAGFPGRINVRSFPQLSKFLFRILALPVTKYTERGGEPSTDQESLDPLIGTHPFVDGLVEYRKYNTMVTYLLAVWNHIKHDGRIHPEVLLHGTRTGRRSYHNPAMQTIPKGYEKGFEWMAELRRMFVPDSDEYILVEADYSQVELWVAWAFSHDPALLEALQSGDFHRSTACFVFNRNWQDYDGWAAPLLDGERFIAKKVIYGIFYGEGPEGLSNKRKGIGRPVEEAERYLNAVLDKYHVYRYWMEQTKRRAESNGVLVSPSGRKRRFHLVLDDHMLRQAVNYPVQSAASDHPLLSLIELQPLLDKYGGSRILLEVHDSLVMQVHRSYFNEVVSLVREVMERPKFPGFPGMKVDIKAGPNWYDVKKV